MMPKTSLLSLGFVLSPGTAQNVVLTDHFGAILRRLFIVLALSFSAMGQPPLGYRIVAPRTKRVTSCDTTDRQHKPYDRPALLECLNSVRRATRGKSAGGSAFERRDTALVQANQPDKNPLHDVLDGSLLSLAKKCSRLKAARSSRSTSCVLQSTMPSLAAMTTR